jgi:hypothetical protein
MHRVGFEPTIPVFERPETVRASYCSAIGIGAIKYIQANLGVICLYVGRGILFKPVVLRGCGTWSLTRREVHRLRVFDWICERGLNSGNTILLRKCHLLVYLCKFVCSYGIGARCSVQKLSFPVLNAAH